MVISISTYNVIANLEKNVYSIAFTKLKFLEKKNLVHFEGSGVIVKIGTNYF